MIIKLQMLQDPPILFSTNKEELLKKPLQTANIKRSRNNSVENWCCAVAANVSGRTIRNNLVQLAHDITGHHIFMGELGRANSSISQQPCY